MCKIVAAGEQELELSFSGKRNGADRNMLKEAVMEQFAAVKRSKDGQPVRYLVVDD